MSIQTKICGLKDAATVKAAVAGGAAFVGLVFYPASPRAVDFAQAAELSSLVPPPIKKVGLFVDPTNETLVACLAEVPLDMIQLHGTEPPKRVAQIAGLTGLPVIKAIRVARSKDLADVKRYEVVADWLLFDAKATDPKLLGGTGQSFDWSLLKDIQLSKPWMLAGGLNDKNLAEAVHMTGARVIDVSSGVEDAPGQKNPTKITALLEIAAKL